MSCYILLLVSYCLRKWINSVKVFVVPTAWWRSGWITQVNIEAPSNWCASGNQWVRSLSLRPAKLPVVILFSESKLSKGIFRGHPTTTQTSGYAACASLYSVFFICLFLQKWVSAWVQLPPMTLFSILFGGSIGSPWVQFPLMTLFSFFFLCSYDIWRSSWVPLLLLHTFLGLSLRHFKNVLLVILLMFVVTIIRWNILLLSVYSFLWWWVWHPVINT